jgi:hypothetical protein
MKHLDLVVIVAVWAAVVFAAVVGITNMADMVVRDLPGDFVEGVVLAGQQDVLEGRSLYDRDRWSRPPYSINLYPYCRCCSPWRRRGGCSGNCWDSTARRRFSGCCCRSVCCRWWSLVPSTGLIPLPSRAVSGAS